MPSERPDTPHPSVSPLPAEFALLKSLPVPVVRVDQQGLVCWANGAAEAALGSVQGQAVAALWRTLGPAFPQDAQAHATGHWFRLSTQALAGGEALWTLESIQSLRETRAELDHQLELLDLAREFGRLGVWERDVRTLKGRWDREVLRFWGLNPDQGTPDFAEATRNILREDRAKIGDLFTRSIKQAGHYSTRYRVRGHDGQVRRIHSQWLVKNGEDGQPERVLGLMMDDSEPYALAQSAQELESQLALAVQLAGIIIWRHDLATGRMHYSDAGWKALGLEPRPEGLTLEEVRATIHPDDLAAVVASAEAAMASPHPVDAEARYRHADGHWVHLLLRRTVLRDDQGHPRAFLGVSLDVTLRREAQQALVTAEERVRLAALGVGLGAWEMDLDTNEAHWDAHMWRLRGHPPQPRAMTYAERMACVHPDDVERLKSWLPAAMDTEGTYEHQFRIIWPDGRVRWLASRSAAIVDESGRRRRIGVNWDVTDSRTADTARREREIALRDSEAKSQFMARMSHELRTPLNAVLGFTQLLMSEEKGDDATALSRRRRLEHIRSAGQHLLSLINDVLELSGVAGGEVQIALKPVALSELLDSTLPLLGTLREERQVRLESAMQGLTVMADATRLRQVLLNLLSNAIKYNKAGGLVRVDAERRGTQVVLRVRDNGRGMDETQRRHLFEPFNRLGADREAIEGTGIGLAIVKTLVERMGGQVSVQSTPGEGSCFEVTLTAAPEATAAAPAAEPPRAALAEATGANGLRRVLYIEDNPVNALIIGELLARRGDLALEVAVDGASGVAQAAASRPDLILLDMQLPDFDGYEVLRRLRAEPRTAPIPCIALSANAMPQDIERALKAGMSDYWTKPLDFKAFMASLEALFGKPA